jgi:hypothetical protein
MAGSRGGGGREWLEGELGWQSVMVLQRSLTPWYPWPLTGGSGVAYDAFFERLIG